MEFSFELTEVIFIFSVVHVIHFLPHVIRLKFESGSFGSRLAVRLIPLVMTLP